MTNLTREQAVQAAARKAWPVEGAPMPRAKVVRAALRAAGLEHLIESVTTSKRACRVWMHDADSDETLAANREAVREVLSLLWADADDRIRTTGITLVSIYMRTLDGAPWYETTMVDLSQEG